MLRGLDVSRYQGDLSEKDWDDIARIGCRYALVKVAEGLGQSPDPLAERDISRARAAGLVVGGYSFLHPELSPEDQAKIHFKLSQDVGLGQVGDLPPCIDLESPKPKDWSRAGLSPLSIRERALAYAELVEELWAQTPTLYTYPDYWMNLGGGSEPKFTHLNLWIASYTVKGWPVDGQRPLILKPWTAWTFWQWSGGSVKLPSSTPCDLDVFWGGETELQALLRKPDVVVETTDPVGPGEDSKV